MKRVVARMLVVCDVPWAKREIWREVKNGVGAFLVLVWHT